MMKNLTLYEEQDESEPRLTVRLCDDGQEIEIHEIEDDTRIFLISLDEAEQLRDWLTSVLAASPTPRRKGKA